MGIYIKNIIIDRLTTARQQDNKDNPTCIIIIMSSIKKKGSYANANGNGSADKTFDVKVCVRLITSFSFSVPFSS